MCRSRLVHLDTTYKIPPMIEFRDRLAKEWNLKAHCRPKRSGARGGAATYPNGKATRVQCCNALKKDALKAMLDEHHFTGLIVGVRRDEEANPRQGALFQRPGPEHALECRRPGPRNCGDQFNTPILPPVPTCGFILCCTGPSSTSGNISSAKEIPVIPLYFANEQGRRYRSLGCAPCTSAIESSARSVAEIIEELRGMKDPERFWPRSGPGKRSRIRTAQARWIHVTPPARSAVISAPATAKPQFEARDRRARGPWEIHLHWPFASSTPARFPENQIGATARGCHAPQMPLLNGPI